MGDPKAPVDPRWEKDRVGRISWRRDEMFESWAERKREYVKERDRKQEERARQKKSGRPPYEQRTALALHTLREDFNVSDFEITACYGTPFPEYLGLGDLELRARDRQPGKIDDGVDGVRVDMFEWVLETHHTKSSEAFCDLDCCLCPRITALNCAAQNFTAAETDGFYISLTDPLDYR